MSPPTSVEEKHGVSIPREHYLRLSQPYAHVSHGPRQRTRRKKKAVRQGPTVLIPRDSLSVCSVLSSSNIYKEPCVTAPPPKHLKS